VEGRLVGGRGGKEEEEEYEKNGGRHALLHPGHILHVIVVETRLHVPQFNFQCKTSSS